MKLKQMKRIFFTIITVIIFPQVYCQTDQDYYKRGIAKSEAQDYKGAIVDYDKAIGINPKYLEAYNNRGIAKTYIQDFKGAIDDFNKAIKINPKDARVYNNRGTAKRDLQDFKGAVEDYTKAIQIDPEFTEAYFNRGNAKGDLQFQDFKGAVEDFTKAIQIDPEFADAYFNRGIAKGNLQDFKAAIEDFTIVIKIKPDGADAYLKRGLAKCYLIEFTEAIDDLNKAIEINPKFADAYYGRGVAKVVLGQKDSGCLDLNKAGELGSPEAYEVIKKYCPTTHSPDTNNLAVQKSEKIYAFNRNNEYIQQFMISESGKYLVLLFEYKYIRIYNMGTWTEVLDYKSPKFISIKDCYFSDNDNYFYAKYGNSFQKRIKINVLSGQTTNINEDEMPAGKFNPELFIERKYGGENDPELIYKDYKFVLKQYELEVYK
jgi:tetratricopeptide (TPR) repeat protein